MESNGTIRISQLIRDLVNHQANDPGQKVDLGTANLPEINVEKKKKKVKRNKAERQIMETVGEDGRTTKVYKYPDGTEWILTEKRQRAFEQMISARRKKLKEKGKSN